MQRLIRALPVLFCLSAATAAEPAGTAPLAPVGDHYVIDVRTVEEWNAGHIEGAALVPYESIGAKIAGLVPDKDAPIALYCRSGRRSGIALDALRKLGYTNVVNYGGFAQAQRLVGASLECRPEQSC